MSPQVSRTLLSILSVFNNAVLSIVSTHLPISKSSSPSINPLVVVHQLPLVSPSSSCSIFFSSLPKDLRYLSLFLPSFNYPIIVIIYSLEFFTSVTSDGFSLEIEWQHNLLKSPGLFPVFWPSLIMLSFGWSQLVCQLPIIIIIIIIIIITIIIMIPSRVFHTSVTSLEFEWQQVTSNLKDSSQYFSPSQ